MILSQEGDSEFVINRQNAKLQFLQNENNNLQQDIGDLQKVLKLNKDALRLAFEQQNSMNKKFIPQHHANSFSLTIPFEQNQQVQNSLEIYDKLEHENQILRDSLFRCLKERNENTTKILLQDQIKEETNNFYKEVIQELEEKVLELRRIIQDKEYTIQTLEKRINLPDKDGVLMKIREIISPNEQSLSLYGEIQQLKELNNKQGADLLQFTQENQILQESNRNIKHELLKMKTLVCNPINFQTMKNFMACDVRIKENSDLEIYQAFFKEMMMNQYKEEIQNQKQIQVNNPQTQRFQQQMTQLRSPKSPRSRIELIEKIENLEQSSQKYKKLYYKAQKGNQELQESMLQYQKSLEELVFNRKEIIQANLNQQVQLQNMSKELKYYKQFFDMYMRNIRRKTKSLEKFHTILQQKQDIVQLNKFIQSDQQQKVPENQQQIKLLKSDYIYLLQKLQKDMSEDYFKIQLFQNQTKEITIKKYRSLSDPIDYFHTMYDEKLGYKEYKKKIKITKEEEIKFIKKDQKGAPFLLDVSIIQNDNNVKIKNNIGKLKQQPLANGKKYVIDASFISNDGGEIIEFK